jgi:hypothetical protein
MLLNILWNVISFYLCNYYITYIKDILCIVLYCNKYSDLVTKWHLKTWNIYYLNTRETELWVVINEEFHKGQKDIWCFLNKELISNY